MDILEFGILRSFKRISQLFVCQMNKVDSRSPAGLLVPLPIPEQVWVDISMDFITRLPRLQGKDIIFVVVERLLKYTISLF